MKSRKLTAMAVLLVWSRTAGLSTGTSHIAAKGWNASSPETSVPRLLPGL